MSADTEMFSRELDAIERRFEAEEEEPTRKPVVKLSDFFVDERLFESDQLPDAIIEGLVFGPGSTTCAGASKVGKSFAAYQMALCVASGKKFLGLKTVQSKTLIMSKEMAAAPIRSRLEGISRDVGLPDWQELMASEALHVIAPTRDLNSTALLSALTLATDVGANLIRDLIRFSGARFVVVDTLYRFLLGMNPLDQGEMGLAYDRINRIAAETGSALFILDHVARKGTLEDIPVSQSMMGAQTKGGASNSIVLVTRRETPDGPKWQLAVESHFGDLAKPIHYERPVRADGIGTGVGCVRTSEANARGVDLWGAWNVFRAHGKERADGYEFTSRRALEDALRAEGLAGQGAGAADRPLRAMVGALGRLWCRAEDAEPEGSPRAPILVDKRAKTHRYVWTEGQPLEGDFE